MSEFAEKKLPVIPLTQEQLDFLDAWKKTTGASYAGMIRVLIQEKMDGKK